MISYFYAMPACTVATNLPNLVDRIKLQSDTSCHVRARANVPHFDVQRTSGALSTNVPNLVDRHKLVAVTSCLASTGQLARLYGRLPESTPIAMGSNQFLGNRHRIVTPMTLPMMSQDTFIEAISWTGMLGAGHVMEILDEKGGVVVRGVSGQASDSNFSELPVKKFVAGGYRVPTLDSGVLVVTLGSLSRNACGAGRGN